MPTCPPRFSFCLRAERAKIPNCNTALANIGGDPSGWAIPEGGIARNQEFMASQGIGIAMLSLTSPGCCLLQGAESTQLARSVNEEAAAIRDAHPSQFGFFASVPEIIDNMDAAIAEIVYALDVLKADGVTLYSRYGEENYYIGHPEFAPLWEELDRRGCVIFLHPTHTAHPKFVNSHLPQPVMDYPHETARAATDLIMGGVIRKHKNIKIILSHAGGTLPYLAGRIATSLADCGFSEVPEDEFMEDAKRFYFDTALSSNPYTLGLLLQFTGPENVLFGSDFPYASHKNIQTNTRGLEKHDMLEEMRDNITRSNAIRLFPRLASMLEKR
ncbi:MAG: hypothetical protein Q9191_000015 [Dirinaria sp. TL-2023a]